MVKNCFNQYWLYDYINDLYVKMVQWEGYCVCVVYKLKEIDEQDKLICLGQVIVDFGVMLGSWSQYVCNKFVQGKKCDVECEGGIDGMIVVFDILLMELIVDVYFLQGDFCEDDVFYQFEEVFEGCVVDFVIFDMVFNFFGVVLVDVVCIEYFCDLVFEFVQNYLKLDGVLFVKCFYGSGYSQIVEKFKQQFKVVVLCKFKVFCDKLFEMFILGWQLKYLC